MTTDVLGIDVTTSGLSLCRYAGGDSIPIARYLQTPAVTDRSVEGMVTYNDDLADALAERILAGGTAALAVLNKPTAAALNADPSAARRLGLWWALARALGDADIPVAEGPGVLAVVKLVQNVQPSGFRACHERIGIKVRDIWSGIELPADAGFRAASVLYAVCGAMVLGTETRVELTDTRRGVLGHMTLPTGLTVPACPKQSA